MWCNCRPKYERLVPTQPPYENCALFLFFCAITALLIVASPLRRLGCDGVRAHGNQHHVCITDETVRKVCMHENYHCRSVLELLPYYKDCAPVLLQPVLVAPTTPFPIAYYANVKGNKDAIPNKTRNHELLVDLDNCATINNHIVYDLNNLNLKVLENGEIVIIDVSILPVHMFDHNSRGKLPGFNMLYSGSPHSGDSKWGYLENYVDLDVI